jgi:hypothetical protein
MSRDGPTKPIFDVGKRRGAVRIGSQLPSVYVPPIPPFVPTCPVHATVVDAAITDVQAVATSGNYAFVGSYFGSTVAAINLSDPDAPVVVGSITDSDLSGVSGLAISGTTLFAACEGSNALVSIDISDPTTLAILHTFTNGSLSGPDSVAINGTVAYVPSFGTKRVFAIDISTPSAMTLISSVQDTTHLTGAFAIAHNGANTVVVGTLGGGTNRLTIVDVTNPAAMVVSDFLTHADINDVYAVYCTTTTAFAVCNFTAKLVAADITDPYNVTRIASFTSLELGDPQGIAVDGDIAYLTMSPPGGVFAIDISDPRAMVAAGSVEDAVDGYLGGGWGIAQSGDFLVVAANSPELVSLVHTSCVTTRPPAAINYVATVSLADQPWGIAIYGTYALVTCGGANDRVLVLDLSTPSLPAVIGTVINNVALNTPRDIAIYGTDRAVAACFSSGRAALIGFDVPTVPQIRDTEIGFTGPLGMAVGGDHAYMADQLGNSVVSLDLSVVDNITTADTLTHAWIADPSSVSVEGTIAAVPNESSSEPRLNLIDISDPTNLSIIGSVSDANLDSSFDVRLRDDIAWVCSYGGPSPINAVDCSDPTTPTLIGTLLGSPIGISFTIELYVTAAGTFPLISDFTTDEVNLIDGRDPTAMTIIDTTGLGGAGATIRRMAVYQNYVYVVESFGGSLRVLEIT